jgi:hypothetical protein
MAYDVFSTKRIAELEAKLEFANTSIDAMLIANKKLKVEIAELRKDAVRYRWLRKQHWDDSVIVVVSDPKQNVRIGTYCPSDGLLDAAIDAARGEHDDLR